MNRRTADVMERGFTDHLLVCTTDREEHACCADADGAAVFDAATAWLRERDVLWTSVHVARTSCLGLCSADGTALAIQPRNEWYSDVRPDDVPTVLAREFGEDADALGDPERPATGATPTE